MNRSHCLVKVMAEVSDLLSRLDLAELPEIHMVTAKPHRGEPDTFDGSAMLRPTFGPEIDCINAVRTWAVAIGGVVLLGDEIDPGTDYAHRKLFALLPLPSGGLFEVWTSLYDLGHAPDQAPAAELIPA